MEDPSNGIARKMKRALSIELIQQQQRYQQGSSSATVNFTTNNINNSLRRETKKFATDSRNILATNNNNNNDDDDDNDEIILLNDVDDEHSELVKKNLNYLETLFPSVSTRHLIRTLERFGDHNTNALNLAIDELFANPPPEEIAVIGGGSGDNSKNSKKTPSLSHVLDKTLVRSDLEFVKSVFPSINTKSALQVINRVHQKGHMMQSNEIRRNHIIDDIMIKNLNENAPTSVSDTNTPEPAKPVSNLDHDYEQIVAVISDCEPEYIREQLKKLAFHSNRVQMIIDKMLENKNYPRLKDYLRRIQKQKDLDAHINLNVNFDEFLKLFPNPHEFFHNKEKEMSENYKMHCRVLLYNNFTLISKDSLESVLIKNGYHLTPAFRQLEDAYTAKKQSELQQRIETNKALHKRLQDNQQMQNLNLQNHPHFMQHMLNQRKMPTLKFSRKGIFYKLENEERPLATYPESLDDRFFKEWYFLKHERELQEHRKNRDLQRARKLAQAKESKSLLECICCYNNQLIDEDLLSCIDEKHKFCKECVKSYAETNISNCKYNFVCLEGTCESEFSLQVLKEAIDQNLFATLVRNKQNEEIKKANIPNLEACPYCIYCEIIENTEEKVFYCRNPECMKETCRKCQEPNHLPLRCDEIEKKQEVNMRTWIENRVTESMIRVCYKCQKRFYKTEGCNMMHCVCGASSCYVCRQPIKGYDHFAQPNGCKQNSDVGEIHQNEMEEAYKKATEEYMKLHPEAKEIELKYDPKKLLEGLSKEKAKKKAAPPQPAIPGVMNFLQMDNNNLAEMQRQAQNDMNRLIEMRFNQHEDDEDDNDDDDDDSDIVDDDEDSDIVYGEDEY